MAEVTYTIPMTPENAGKIDAVNRILLGGNYTAEAPKTAAADNIVADEQRETAKGKASQEETATDITLDQVKKAAKKAKSAHGEDFANEALDSLGVKEASTLGRRMSAIGEDQYAELLELWAAGPVTPPASDELDDDDGLGDDDDGLGDDDSEVTVEAVQTALKAYAKEVGRAEAKEIMQKHGAEALSKVADCSPKQLSAMMAELV